jgi:copper homeostasis protein (lipoprotein)
MNISTYLYQLLLPAVLLVSCAPSAEPTDPDSSTPDMHTSSVALDWHGTYQGVLPCASCEGIQTSLTLGHDMQYVLERVYVGESDSLFTSVGSFEWDDSGNVVVLAGINDAPNRFKVMEGAVAQLDLEGNEITGELASNYRLLFVQPNLDQTASNDFDTVAEKKFLLVELMGKPYAAGIEDKAPYITFDRIEKRASGNAGCNTFIGSYNLQDGSRIRFSQLASTMMACPEMDIEQEFMKVLETTDNYNYDGKNLVLNRARMAPLARFIIEP